MIALCQAIIAFLSHFVPGERRRDWQAEWNGELFELVRRAERVPNRYGTPQRAAFTFTLGALPHAIHEWKEGWTMELLLHDLRSAIRSVLRNRGFAITAILLIAVGVGANTTVFTLVEAVLFRPPAGVVEADRIVQIGRGKSDQLFDNWSYPRYLALAQDQRAFTGLTAYASTDVVIGEGDDTELTAAQLVTANYFNFLGARLVAGRSFTADEESQPDAHAVVVISDELWTRRFNRAKDVIGKTLIVRGRPFEIVGLAAPGFMGVDIGYSAPDFWAPVAMYGQLMGRGMELLSNPNLSWLWIAGRLKPDVGVGQAQLAMSALMTQLERDRPADRRDSIVLVQGLGLRPEPRAIANRIFAVLLAVVGGLLLIASANLAGLLLARGAARKGEMAVRLAIGASRGRLVRQLVMETVWIALFGSIAAFLLTFWTANLVKPLIPYDVAVTYTPDLRVLAFALIVGVVTSAVFGIAPAWNAARTDLITLIRSDASGIRGDRGRVRWALAVGQFAVSFVLLASTGLLVRSVQGMNAIDPGFRTEDVLAGNLELGTAGSQGPNAGAQVATIVQRVAAMPGVIGVARASAIPAAGAMSTRGMWRPDAFDPSVVPPAVRYMTIDTAYLPTMGVRLASGRNFTSADSSTSAPVMIINETLAKQLFPSGDAVGHQLAYATLEGPRVTEVIGVAADTKNRSLREPPGPQAYVPVAQDARGRVILHVRTSTPSSAFASRLSAAVREAVPGVPSVAFTTVRERLGSSLADMRLIASLGGLFSALALVLAVSGLYGVIAYGAARRRREFGVRLALGASPWQVAQLVAGQAFTLVSVALVVGVLGALGTGRLLRSQLFGVTSYDPVTFGVMAAVLCVAALCAALVPAYSAARTDPIGSLRQ